MHWLSANQHPSPVYLVSNATQNFRSTARSQFAKSASDEHKKSPSKLQWIRDKCRGGGSERRKSTNAVATCRPEIFCPCPSRPISSCRISLGPGRRNQSAVVVGTHGAAAVRATTTAGQGRRQGWPRAFSASVCSVCRPARPRRETRACPAAPERPRKIRDAPPSGLPATAHSG